jgi:hypothetical protein
VEDVETPGDGRRHESVTDEQWAVMCMTSQPFGHLVGDDGRCVACTLAMGKGVAARRRPRPAKGGAVSDAELDAIRARARKDGLSPVMGHFAPVLGDLTSERR